MKNLFVVITTLVVVLSSCSLQKRHYLKGYYVNHKKSNHTDQKDGFKEAVTKTEDLSSELIKTRLMESNEIKEPVLLATTKPVVMKNKVRPLQNYLLQKETVKKTIRKFIEKPEKENNNKGISILRTLLIIFGIILTLSSIYYFFFSVIALGAIIFMAFVGLSMWIVGGAIIKNPNKKKKENNSNGGEYQDVVYLKNGSIIRGMIIEQVPGISIKLETKDGNIFVYKMEDIEKMTKEKQR